MQSFNLGGDSAFFLMRPDGGVILRFPFKPKAIAAGLGDPDVFRKASLTAPEGNHEFDLPDNGMTRVSGFVRSEQTGVTAIAMRSKAALFHFWVQRSKYPWLGMLVAYIGALALAVRWMRQSHLRELGEQRIAAREAEFRLIANASTDVIEKISLTGVREYVSPAAAKIFEQSAESLIGTNVLDNRDEQTRMAWKMRSAVCNLAPPPNPFSMSKVARTEVGSGWKAPSPAFRVKMTTSRTASSSLPATLPVNRR